MMITLRVLSRLLIYPMPELIAALPDCRVRLAGEAVLAPATGRRIDDLLARMAARDLLDLQEDYVALFDRTPSLSLHLFEHIHGDGRDRGQALADLMAVYRDAGLTVIAPETPDYLPLFLEYLSNLDSREAVRNLGDIVDILGMLQARLANRQSVYERIFAALIELAPRRPDRKMLRRALGDAAGAPPTPAETDRAWAEDPAFAPPPSDGARTEANCPRSADILRRMG